MGGSIRNLQIPWTRHGVDLAAELLRCGGALGDRQRRSRRLSALTAFQPIQGGGERLPAGGVPLLKGALFHEGSPTSQRAYARRRSTATTPRRPPV